MLPTLQEQFVTSTWLIGWMVAFVNAGGYFAGVLATPLKERFGARTVVTVSGLVAGISMITASFLSSLYVITFILTVITAIGISYVITKHLIGSYFNKSITTAYAMSSIGNSFVFVAFVPLIQLFLDIYGWRGTMLLLGGLSLHIAVCGALVKPPAASRSQDGYEAAHTDEEQETRDDDGQEFNITTTQLQHFSHWFNVVILILNPGPTTQDSIRQYSSRYLHSVRAKCDKLKVPPPTWNIIKTLGLNTKPATRRGHRGGLKTHRNAVNLQHPIIHNNNNVNNEKIDVLIRPRLPAAPSFQEKSAIRLQSRCLTKVTITTTARPKKTYC
ncbi:uncharacterized protein [Asterias amurensis]|uniref:uncharacterized protein n=1 Tax=Asterias amurensis TaxID=7602 RepID=UPI003AB627D3